MKLKLTKHLKHIGIHCQFVSIWLVFGLGGVGLTACAGGASISYPQGIFAMSRGARPIPKKLLAHSAVSGIVVRDKWRNLEPRENEYDWRYFDEQLARVAKSGKLASLVLTYGGLAVPEWLLKKNMRFFNFTNRNSFSPKFGKQVSTPLFWDANFLRYKKRLIMAMGKRYAEYPGLVLVSAQCANAITDDWNIPKKPENIRQWRTLDYSTEKLLRACQEMIDVTMKAFPKQIVKMAIGPVPKALDSSPLRLAKAIIRYAQKKYPGRLIVQRHNLSAKTPDPRKTRRLWGWQVILDNRPAVAAQMLWSAADTRSCRLNGRRKPCDSETMLAEAVDIGLAYGVRYLEIYGVDLLRFYGKKTILQAAQKLTKSVGKPIGYKSPQTLRAAVDKPISYKPQRSQQSLALKSNPWPWVNVPTKRRGLSSDVEHHVFDSKAIGEKVGFSIYLPPSYTSHPGKRYPIVYWLHGKNGNEIGATRLVGFVRSAIKKKQISEVIMVFVNAGRESFYSDSYDGLIPVETMLIKELIPFVEANFRTLGERSGRFLWGFSMGGFGALKFAAKYPEYFGGVISYGGALLFYRKHARPRKNVWFFQHMFNNDSELFIANTPAYWFQKNRKQILKYALDIRIVASDNDNTRRSNDRLHKLLQKLNIPHEYVLLNGVRHNSAEYFRSEKGAGFSFLTKCCKK